MGSSSSCQTLKLCQEKEVNAGSVFNSITINAIIESSECIPFEAKTLQLYKSQKSHLCQKENEFEKQRIADQHTYQNPSIKILDSLDNIQNSFYIQNQLKYCLGCRQDFLNSKDVILECNDYYHSQCFVHIVTQQVQNGDCKLFCLCGKQMHTKFVRNYVSEDILEKLFSNQLGTIYKNNQKFLSFDTNSKQLFKENCFHCKKAIISQKVILQCKHELHKYCLKDMCNEQIDKDQSYLLCFCGAQIQTQLLRKFKSDSFKQILQKLFKNQLIQLYNTNKYLQRTFHFKQFIKAVNFENLQKQSSYSKHE